MRPLLSGSQGLFGFGFGFGSISKSQQSDLDINPTPNNQIQIPIRILPPAYAGWARSVVRGHPRYPRSLISTMVAVRGPRSPALPAVRGPRLPTPKVVALANNETYPPRVPSTTKTPPSHCQRQRQLFAPRNYRMRFMMCRHAVCNT